MQAPSPFHQFNPIQKSIIIPCLIRLISIPPSSLVLTRDTELVRHGAGFVAREVSGEFPFGAGGRGGGSCLEGVREGIVSKGTVLGSNGCVFLVVFVYRNCGGGL